MKWMVILKYFAGVVAGLGIAWAVYAGVIRPVTKPNPNTTQSAETIINHNYGTPKVYFGCLNMRIYERKEKDISGPDSVNTISPTI
jgi:hypothetical protein